MTHTWSSHKIGDDLNRKLEQISDDEGLSKSGLVAEALDQYAADDSNGEITLTDAVTAVQRRGLAVVSGTKIDVDGVVCADGSVITGREEAEEDRNDEIDISDYDPDEPLPPEEIAAADDNTVLSAATLSEMADMDDIPAIHPRHIDADHRPARAADLAIGLLKYRHGDSPVISQNTIEMVLKRDLELTYRGTELDKRVQNLRQQLLNHPTDKRSLVVPSQKGYKLTMAKMATAARDAAQDYMDHRNSADSFREANNLRERYQELVEETGIEADIWIPPTEEMRVMRIKSARKSKIRKIRDSVSNARDWIEAIRKGDSITVGAGHETKDVSGADAVDWVESEIERIESTRREIPNCAGYGLPMPDSITEIDGVDHSVTELYRMLTDAAAAADISDRDGEEQDGEVVSAE